MLQEAAHANLFFSPSPSTQAKSVQAPGQLSSQSISPTWSPSMLNNITPLLAVSGPSTMTELSLIQPTAEHVAAIAVGRHEVTKSVGRMDLNILVKDIMYMTRDISGCDRI